MKTECPFCCQHYEVADEFLDKVVECPQCKEEFCVQPIIAEQTAVKPSKITLTPIFANESSDKTSAANISSNNLLDSAEDDFVVQSLKKLKISNLIFTIIITIFLFLFAFLAFNAKDLRLGILFLFIIIPVLYHYFIVNIALSWFRGIYRNVMWFSFAQTMPTAKLKKQ